MAQPESIGDRVKLLRNKEGWTQEELASKLHLGRTGLKNKELGTRDFTPDELLELSQIFGVSLDWLIRGVKTKNLDIYRSLGLDDAAIKGIREHNTDMVLAEVEPGTGKAITYIQPDSDLNAALASPAILEALSQYMGFRAEMNEYFVGNAKQGKGYVDCRMSEGMYQAVLGQNLLRVMDAVKRGEEPELFRPEFVFDPVEDEEGGAEDAEEK